MFARNDSPENPSQEYGLELLALSCWLFSDEPLTLAEWRATIRTTSVRNTNMVHAETDPSEMDSDDEEGGYIHGESGSVPAA
jgi:hypothetical protein